MKPLVSVFRNARKFDSNCRVKTANTQPDNGPWVAVKMSGYSLLELTSIILILGIMAAVIIPNFSSTDPAKLDLAVSEVMQAIRLARSESIRSGEMHGLTISQNTQKIEVKKYDLTTAPISTDFKLYHPLEKQIYEFYMEREPLTRGVKISNAQDAFLYNDFQRRKSVLFDHSGAPVWFKGSDDTTHLLMDGRVELSYGGKTRTVKVAPMTGRVTQQ